jgi:hypothetical protein
MCFEPIKSALEWSEKARLLDIAKVLEFFFGGGATATLSARRHRLVCTALQARHLRYFAARVPK